MTAILLALSIARAASAQSPEATLERARALADQPRVLFDGERPAGGTVVEIARGWRPPLRHRRVDRAVARPIEAPSPAARAERRARAADVAMETVAFGAGLLAGWAAWVLGSPLGPWVAGLAALVGFYMAFTAIWAGYGVATDRDFLKGG